VGIGVDDPLVQHLGQVIVGPDRAPRAVTVVAMEHGVEHETLLYEVADGVAWVTLNRPEVHNAFNRQMQTELKSVWRALRHDADVRCVVLTGAGEKAFCSGVDRTETMGHWLDEPEPDGEGTGTIAAASTWNFDDPGENLGPKANDLWTPVIAAVNGIACGGAFYMLGEVEFIIAAEHATFFDPHVSYGMAACFESMHMLQKMPFHEIARLALLGAHERLSAARAYEIGLVSEVVPSTQLRERVEWAARAIASAPAIAIQGTVRALWTARELSRRQALDMGKALIRAGSDPVSLREGQRAFASGARIEPHIR
jgi:enoyl-CoA hydratase/carnithine racemase